ncbi:MAG: hypothetical protein ACI84C_002519 [Flavobacteriales bacterium]|jgi:hypothetical protein
MLLALTYTASEPIYQPSERGGELAKKKVGLAT